MCSREWAAAASSLLPVAVMKPCPSTDQAHSVLLLCIGAAGRGILHLRDGAQLAAVVSSLEQSLLVPLGVWVRANVAD